MHKHFAENWKSINLHEYLHITTDKGIKPNPRNPLNWVNIEIAGIANAPGVRVQEILYNRFEFNTYCCNYFYQLQYENGTRQESPDILHKQPFSHRKHYHFVPIIFLLPNFRQRTHVPQRKYCVSTFKQGN